MIKSDPIIAVQDVQKSSTWYQTVLGCKSMHGGDEFDILVNERSEVILCLHKWGAHEHPTLKDKNITPGNGLLLYFRTDNMEAARKNAEKYASAIEEEVFVNPNTNKKEFSIRDLDGYYLTISEYHDYAG